MRSSLQMQILVASCVASEACVERNDPCVTEYIGGSPESISVASEAIKSFHESVGLEVYQCVRAVEFAELELVNGRRKGHNIYTENHEEKLLFHIVSHEICHVHQDILDTSDTVLFELITNSLSYEDRTESTRHNESFAQSCAYGGEILSLVGDICPTDILADRLEVFDIILKEIYRAQESPAQAPPMHWEEAGSIPWSRGTPIDDVRGAEGGVIRILMADTDMLYVDARTGEPVSMVPAESWESGPPTWPGLGLESWATAGDDTLLVMSITAGNGAKARRVLHQGTDGRRSRLACGRHQEHVFALEGSLWSLYVDEEADRLHWGRWVRE